MIFAIDPGNVKSAYVLYDPENHKLIEFGKIENEVLMGKLADLRDQTEQLAIEGIQSYGMRVGQTTFDTCIWIGRYLQQWERIGGTTKIIYRREVKKCITPKVKSNDSVIRKALIKMFPAIGLDSKGSPSSIGVKKSPGPLYGVTADCWSALAISLTFHKKISKETK